MDGYHAKYSYENYNDTELDYDCFNGLSILANSEAITSEGDGSMEELMQELRGELASYLDGDYSGETLVFFYDDYDRNSLCAFRFALEEELENRGIAYNK